MMSIEIHADTMNGEVSSRLLEEPSSAAKQRRRFKLDWELVFWMIASFSTLYFTNFASNLLFNDKIYR